MNIDLDNEELKALLTQAAKDGAQQALAEVGLDGADAHKDIRELRHLIEKLSDLIKVNLNHYLLVSMALLLLKLGKLLKLYYHKMV